MGNANSNVTDGVKKQADAGGQKLYELVNLKGSGILVELTKQAATTKNYAALDEAIKTKLEPFLYNNGNGRLFHVSKLVIMRNRQRPKHRHIFKNEEDFDNYKEPTPEECKGKICGLGTAPSNVISRKRTERMGLIIFVSTTTADISSFSGDLFTGEKNRPPLPAEKSLPMIMSTKETLRSKLRWRKVRAGRR